MHKEMEFMFQFCCKIIKNIAIGICSIALTSHIVMATPNLEGIREYQNTTTHTRERSEMLAHDLDRYQNADDLWNILRHEFKLSHYEDNPLVQQKIEWFMNHQDFLYRSMSRSAPYLYFILQQVKKRHLPAEVMLLPIIESSYNPFAYSYRGAAGIWQMMPGTASDEGLRQNWWYDGRRDIIASTRGALNHLSYLQSFFDGNWLLAIAAYNTGEGNVLAAIRKNINNGENTDFWSLPVAQQTKDYVPQLLALAIIISHPDEYPIQLPPIRNAPYLAQVDAGGQIDLKQAASLAGLSLKQLMQLNPGYSRSAMDPNGPYKLVLPIENVARFTDNLNSWPLYHQVNYARYKVRSGDTYKTIARHFSTSPTVLRKMNPSFAALRPGYNLLIPKNKSSPVQEIPVQQKVKTLPVIKSSDDTVMLSEAIATNYQMQPGDTLYMVRMGDNLDKLATHFHIDKKTLLAVNHLSQDNLQLNQRLIIPTHLKQQAESQHYQLTPGDTIYMVRKGDTIQSVADKFHTTPQAVRLANLMASNALQEGDRLIIPTHV